VVDSLVGVAREQNPLPLRGRARLVETKPAAPLVSVITATYNWSSVLRHAITSVQRQTLTDLEMIIVGDACSDDSGEVVAALNDGRLRWHNRVENSGSQGLPNNDGLAMARGRYVAYLGHDDLWHPTHLETMVATIEESQADMVYALTLLIGPADAPYRDIRGFEPPGGHQRDISLPPSSIMHPRELGLAVGGWRDFRELVHYPDYDFIARLWDAGGGFAPTNRLTVFKFPAAMRPNSYVLKPSQDQARYLDRMATEPDFIEKELLATVEFTAEPHRVSSGWAPGELVTYFRQLRGLEPVPVPDLDLRTRTWRSLRRRFRPAKAAVRRLATWIEAR
jgi:glycosyltransferase involved in cell wall biosynthesis